MLNNNINKYCELQSENESKLQKKIREYTYKHETYPQMISGLLVGNFLYHLIRMNKSKKMKMTKMKMMLHSNVN